SVNTRTKATMVRGNDRCSGECSKVALRTITPTAKTTEKCRQRQKGKLGGHDGLSDYWTRHETCIGAIEQNALAAFRQMRPNRAQTHTTQVESEPCGLSIIYRHTFECKSLPFDSHSVPHSN